MNITYHSLIFHVETEADVLALCAKLGARKAA